MSHTPFRGSRPSGIATHEPYLIQKRNANTKSLRVIAKGFVFCEELCQIWMEKRVLPTVKGTAPPAEWRLGIMPKLHEAAEKGDLKEVKKALSWWRFADVNARDHFWKTPLHFGAAGGNPEVVKFLLEKGADANMKDRFGRTPLHEGAAMERLSVVRLLLEHGADVNARDKGGRTPLHAGAVSLAVVKILIEYGADAGAKDELGLTPYDVAEDQEVRSFLERAAGK